MAFRPLPIGIDNFEKLRCGGYYYVDKTNFIKELLDMRGEVNLFTRPRRFGKTLNMSMLQYYFEDTQDDKTNGQHKELFTGLKIIRQGEKYRSWMGSRPVINLSLKSGKQPDFHMAWDSLTDEIRKEFNRHDSIKASGKLLENEIQRYCDIQNGTASKAYFAKSLEFLSFCLAKCYGKKTIILIDEYDVPLENAWIKNFYNEMIDFLRSLFESALKTNPYLEFAVLTGCLRISKESIFTGLNNPKMISILSEAYGEHFGFLQSEVNEMLDFYGLDESSALLKEWYDGYKFGNAEVYNPWSVISYVDDAVSNKDTLPRPYWNNTSSNTIVRNLIERAEPGTKLEIEQLVAGGVIEKPVHEEVTYDDIHGSEDNLWNFLFFTGYLKKIDLRLIGDDRYVKLALPNREVRHIYNNTIKGWFQETLELKDLNILYESLFNGEAQPFQKELSALLMDSISYMDSREAFYHGFLLGIFENMKGYVVTSNREAGTGRYDIAIRHLDVARTPIIIELKISNTYKGLEAACNQALDQIRQNHYNDWLPEEGYTEVLDYGIAFFKKQCCVKVEKRTFD